MVKVMTFISGKEIKGFRSKTTTITDILIFIINYIKLDVNVIVMEIIEFQIIFKYECPCFS